MTILSTVTLWQRHDPLSPTVLNSKLTPIVSSLSALEGALATGSGATGATGAAGQSPQALSGSVVPDSSVGTDGDTYYLTNPLSFYGPKAAGVWGSGVSLIGANNGVQMTQLGSVVTSSSATLNVGSGLSLSIITGIPTIINTGSGVTGDTGPAGPAGGASITVSNKTDSYTAVYSDLGALVRLGSASVNTFTVPSYSSSTFTIGDTLMVQQSGAGRTYIAPMSGVTINRPSHTTAALAGQYATAVLVKTAEDIWDIPAVGLLSTEIVSQDVSIVTNVVTIDYSAGRDVNLTLNSGISRFDVTNSNDSGTVSSLAVWLSSDGTARVVTWSINSVVAIWDDGTAPSSNTTSGYLMGVQLYTKNAWLTPRAYLIAQGSHA